MNIIKHFFQYLRNNPWKISFFLSFLFCLILIGINLTMKNDTKVPVINNPKFPIVLVKGEIFKVPAKLDTLWVLKHAQYLTAIIKAKKYETSLEIVSLLKRKNEKLSQLIVAKDSLLNLYFKGYIFYKESYQGTKLYIKDNTDLKIYKQMYEKIINEYAERNEQLERMLNWQKEYSGDLESHTKKQIMKDREYLERENADLKIQLRREKEYVDPDKVTFSIIIQSLRFTHISAIVVFFVTIFGIGFKTGGIIKKSQKTNI